MSPEIAVISAGRNNMYGHPHPDMLAIHSESRIYRADLDGAIGKEEPADGSLELKTWRDSMTRDIESAEGEYSNIKRLFFVW